MHDRVAIVAVLWFAALITAGLEVGRVFGTPGTGVVWGFIFALLSVFVWPWIMPNAIEDWMHDRY